MKILLSSDQEDDYPRCLLPNQKPVKYKNNMNLLDTMK